MSSADDTADNTAGNAGERRPDQPAVRRPEEEPISQNGSSATTSSATTPEEIEAEIRQQRAELAETLDALGAKLDVKAQAQAKASQVKDRATTDSGKPRPELVGAAVVAVAGVVALVWWRRSR